MHLIKPSIKILTSHNMMREMASLIDESGRACWLSYENAEKQVLKLYNDESFEPEKNNEDRINAAENAVSQKFLGHLVKIGHESVLEHSAITVEFITDRAVSHQLVRHRIGAFSQESQRYVDYVKKNDVTFILPVYSKLEDGYYNLMVDRLEQTHYEERVNPARISHIDPSKLSEIERLWINAMQQAENSYIRLKQAGLKSQDARSVLPNATKTKIIATFNVRQWRHVLKERTQPAAQHDIRYLMNKVLEQFKDSPLAVFFNDFIVCDIEG